MARGFVMLPSFQFAKTHLVSGPPCGDVPVTLHGLPFVQIMFAGSVYVPSGQLVPSTTICAAILLLSETEVGIAEKFAVIVDGEFIVKVNGFAVLTTFPLHPVK